MLPFAVTCQSSSRVSQRSESAASSLPVSVCASRRQTRGRRQHSRGFQVASDVRNVNDFTAPMLCLSLSRQGGSAPLWVSSLHPPTRSHSRYLRHCYPSDAFVLRRSHIVCRLLRQPTSGRLSRTCVFARLRHDTGLHEWQERGSSYVCFLFHGSLWTLATADPSTLLG